MCCLAGTKELATLFLHFRENGHTNKPTEFIAVRRNMELLLQRIPRLLATKVPLSQSRFQVLRSYSSTIPSKPLSGLLVLSLEQAVAAPVATCRLADDGARVIKVERSSGDFARAYDKYGNGCSSYFSWLNRGKESLVVDIKDKDSTALLHSILEKADVFVQNLAPGAAARSGFDSKQLREKYPQLITLDISGYGNEGALKTYKAYDLLVAAEAGLCEVTGTPDGPGRVGVSICDITAGMNGYAAIMKGLLLREKTGKGSGYAVSLFDTIADIMNVPLMQQIHTGEGPKRVGLAHPSIAPYGAFETKDKRKILISIQNEREWHKLCSEILGREEIASDIMYSTPSARVENRKSLDDIIISVFKSFNIEELKEKFLQSGIAFGELNTVEGLSNHPILRKASYKNENGDMVTVAAPATINVDIGANTQFENVPMLGEHNDVIISEFGARKK